MKRSLLVGLVLVLSLSLVYAVDPPSDVEKSPPTALTPLMQMKLEKAQTILEGLAL